jgi:NodT family efflux transporter outer membrane factor (OMF) lipoprotein
MKAGTRAALGLAALLTGCARVQTLDPSSGLQAPDHWSGAVAAAAPALDRAAWWKGFGDPLLDDLMARAVRGNLDLQQAQARILQARATLGTAEAARLPSVNATAEVSRSETSANSIGSTGVVPGTTTLYQAGFDASWELDLFGGLRKSQQAAEHRLQASVEDLGDVTLTLLGDVAGNYITLRGNQALLAISRRNAETQQETAAITEQRFRLGLTSYLDVAQAKAEAASTRADLPSLQAAIKQSMHRLGILLGLEPTALEGDLAPVQPLPSAHGVLSAGLPSELIARRPDLRRAERKLAAAMADIGVAKSDLYPKFDLTLGLGLESTQTSQFASVSSRYGSIVPGLSLPIFNRGKLKAAVADKQAVYEEQLAGFQASFHSALEDVENGLANYYSEQERHRDLEEALRQDQDALTLASERYRLGLTSFLEVLTTQQSFYAAQNSLSKSDAQMLTSLVTLYKALGGGWKAL